MQIVDLQYFGSIDSYFDCVNDSNIIFFTSVPFSKGGLHNRCWIAGPNGVQRLSIPIQGGREVKAPLKDVKIDNKTNWQLLHWRTLEACYRSSPWFAHFEPELFAFYHSKVDWLVDWNWWLMEWSLFQLRWKGEVKWITEQLPEVGNKPTDSKGDTQLLSYQQVFTPPGEFIRGLSVIDLLCCTGPQAGWLLARQL